jgi:hypothetical protein
MAPANSLASRGNEARTFAVEQNRRQHAIHVDCYREDCCRRDWGKGRCRRYRSREPGWSGLAFTRVINKLTLPPLGSPIVRHRSGLPIVRPQSTPVTAPAALPIQAITAFAICEAERSNPRPMQEAAHRSQVRVRQRGPKFLAVADRQMNRYQRCLCLRSSHR